MPELKRRAVAGSFILQFPDGQMDQKPKVALFRRSGAVRTYQYVFSTLDLRAWLIIRKAQVCADLWQRRGVRRESSRHSMARAP
jgi:hypothetical protein